MPRAADVLQHPDIDPIAIAIGPVKVHWYGIMYLVGFAGAWWLGRLRAQRPGSSWNAEQVSDLVFYGALGVVAGGRLGYMLFYDLVRLMDDPVRIFRIWEGGMSFHGGLIGVLVAMLLYARKHRKTFFTVTDFLAPLVPLGLGAGRIGNFINGELWGRPTDLSWGMMFPFVDAQPRHPSMLYQALLEGLALFLLLWFYSRRPRPTMAVSGLFLIGYGAFRFLVEFVREPDKHLGYLAGGWLTMGQVLTVPMIVAGLVLMLLAYRRAR
jgi:phosphatidylglycerol:prolipoprotein diacylglycerol transferase